MIEPTTAGAGFFPHLLAQGDEVVSVVVLVIIAIISAVAESKRKRAAKSPNEIARKEKRQYDKTMADMKGQPQKIRAQAEYDQARARRLARQQQKMQQKQSAFNRPPDMVGMQPTARAAGAARLRPGDNSYDRKLAERRTRSQQSLKQAAATTYVKKAQAAAAKMTAVKDVVKAPVTFSEIGAERLPHQPSRADVVQSAIVQRTAHLNDLQRGFIYHEIFSAPRAIRSDVSVWDT